MPKRVKAKRRAPHRSVNGNVLTVKKLSKRHYMVIHGLPRGTRDKTMKALLEMAVAASKQITAWDTRARAGSLRITIGRNA